jgi:hypothetical protein
VARFLAAIQGHRGEATRLGTPASGIRAQAQGWNVGVKVYGEPGESSGDIFTLYATGGSSGYTSELIGRVYLEDGQLTFEPSEWAIAQAETFKPTS